LRVSGDGWWPLPGKPPRQIIESEDFIQDRQAIEPDAKRFDDHMGAAIWAIAVNPSAHPTLDVTDIHVRDTHYGSQTLRFYFRINPDGSVTLLGLKPIEESPEEDESE
jgi:hypothetical protein